jgi:cell wall-associated NlpC family hydrolase
VARSVPARFAASVRKAILLRLPVNRLRLGIASLLGLAAAAVVGTGLASAAPSISELRARVAQIQAEVAAIDEQVEDAAEAYNGAVFRLGGITTRITKNRIVLRKATRDLTRSREILADRLRAAYLKPPPSTMQILLSQVSVSSVVDSVEVLDRAATQDANLVKSVQTLRDQAVAKRRELIADRKRSEDEVATRKRQRDVVTGLLRRRQAVLSGAKGRLAAMLAAERAREARAAREAQRIALERVRSENRGTSSGGSNSGTGLLATGSAGVVSGSGSEANAQAARVALRYLGVPYVWGGASPSGFDCSGLASYAYAQVGKSVPHYTVAIWGAFPRVTGPLQPGDLVFFRGLGHMGIYIGGGQMVAAPRTGDVVKVSAMSGRSDYVGAVRP